MKLSSRALSFVLTVVLSPTILANTLWTDQQSITTLSNQPENLLIHGGRSLMVDTNQLNKIMSQKSGPIHIDIPTPDGKLLSLRLREDSVFAPELAAKFPTIKSFVAYNQFNQRIGRFTFSGKGMHGMYKYKGKTTYLDPVRSSSNQLYRNFHAEQAIPRLGLMRGDTVVDQNLVSKAPSLSKDTAMRTGDVLRTYRLAIAATAEYTEFHNSNANMTPVENAIAALNVLVSRINEIYEQEMAVRFELIAENDQLIFTDPDTDPYANDSSGGELDINQTTLDDIVGNDAYDIGHLVGTGSGGIASLGSVCSTTRKARGLTGLSFPQGDKFYVDFVAHEIGHQFSGNHSFNGTESSCENRNASTAFEPGGGSTIMAYAGICGSQNIQNDSDPYFHIGSLDEMLNFIENGNGGSCAVTTSLSNTIPEADAGADYTIPARTPFILNGSGTDADNDSLTYMWEQYDPNGTPSSSPETMIDNGNRPLFRSFTPQTITSRHFPRFEDVIDGETELGETYPLTTREMNFRLTVRDNNGGVDSDAMVVNTVASSVGFSVRQPDSENSWFAGRPSLLLWNTAGSDSDPISCNDLTLEYTTNNGSSFTELETSLANDGIATVTAPSSVESGMRLRLTCNNSIFYTVSGSFSVLSASSAPADSDGDGISDEFEEANNLDPNNASDASLDSDDDGLTNIEEFFLGTDPNASDSDGDGMPDQYEVSNRLDPSTNDAEADADNDGSSNLEEFEAGTDPNDSGSNPNITTESITFESAEDMEKFTVGNVDPWTRTDQQASEGSFSIVSADVGDNNSSSISLTDTFAPGLVSFDYKVSSEERFDFLQFLIDDELVAEWSGEVDWTNTSHNISEGEQTLTWRFSKDESISNGADVGWVDNISYPVNRSAQQSVCDTGGDSDANFTFQTDNGLDDFDFSLSNPWEFNSDEGNTCSGSLASAGISDNETSTVTYTNTFIEGDVTFFYKVSSESGFDFLSFYVDGEFVESWSGEVDWTKFTQRLTAGEHTLEWRYEKDRSVSNGSDKAWIDDLSVPIEESTTPVEPPSEGNYVDFDYDGDGKADIAVRRASNFTQYIKNSSGSEFGSDRGDDIQRVTFGRSAGDIPVTGDFDGDGIPDVAVRRPSNQFWYIKNSSGVDAISGNEDGITRLRFGRNEEDIPVPADYDGDGITDIAVRRPSNTTWYIRNSSGVDQFTDNDDGITRLVFGRQSEDIPVPADYDGDGRADPAVRRASNQFWYVYNSSGIDVLTNNEDGITRRRFGTQEEDIPVPADFDNDGRADLAVRRPSNQFFYVLNSSGSNYNSEREDGIQRVNFGRQSDDIPVIADYDGDGVADFAVRRPSNQFWYILNSSGGNFNSDREDGIQRVQFASRDTDIPIAAPILTRMEMASSNSDD